MNSCNAQNSPDLTFLSRPIFIHLLTSTADDDLPYPSVLLATSLTKQVYGSSLLPIAFPPRIRLS
jgi:hypothetical protein